MHTNSSSSDRNEEPESGVLYLVGTPIGNLNDISSRAINILRNVSLIACEDTRQTKKITSRFDIRNKLISFNKQNSLSRIPKIINFLKEDPLVTKNIEGKSKKNHLEIEFYKINKDEELYLLNSYKGDV